MLLDRRAERDALARLLEQVRAGLSGAVVLRGEAGIGKTALLEHTIESAADMRVVRVAGVESEMELGFAAVHQLLVPFLPGGLERLPEPQRNALGSAFGLAVGVPADLFLVGLAVLTLLADAATTRPVLCVVDDAQWLDRESAQALAFVARRIFADRIGILFGVREPDEPQLLLEGLPELQLAGLPDDEARALLASVAAGQFSKRVGDRIIRETGGNPLALVELGGELTPGELSGRSQLRQPLPLGRRPEERFLRRVQTLPADTQTLLLIAAAEPSGDQGLLQRAAKHLGIGAEAADAATANRLLTFEPRVAFRHPLIRSAVYHGASALERQRVHEALAAASDPELDADRRAWHLAAAASGPDEDVAAELERSADRARGRGGWASGAAFLERSAGLTPDEGRRAERTLAAAQAKLVAGDPEAARVLLEQAAPQLDRLAGVQARRLEGEIRFGTGQLGESSSILLEAAREFNPLDTRLARDTLLEALEAASFAGRFAIGAGVLDVVRATREAPPTAESEATIADLLLDGFAARLELRHAEAVGLFRRAIAALRGSDDLRWFGLGCFAASELLDDEARRTLARRWVTLARDHGALTSLPLALTFLGETEVRAGRFRSADAIHAEGREISAATGNPGMTGEASPPDLLVLAWRGYETEARSAAEAVRRDQTKRRVGVGVTYVNAALAVLEIGLGNYEAALSCAVSVSEEDSFYHGTHILPELVEGATRCGNRQAAAAALDRLSERALASRAPWALGLLARSRALLAEDAVAESHYEAAIDCLERCDAAPDLARAHLLYGEWLRRQRRRKDARSELRAAHQTFESIGAGAFAQRARRELLATGEHARKRTVETSDELTPQEGRIARLATEGASNPEIAAQLFISPSTVAYHLRKVFRKLDISSRTQLVHAMPDQAGPYVPEVLLPHDDPRG